MMIVRRFRESRDGNFAMMFALTLPMLLGAVALAIDFSSMTKAHSKLQSALDAAVLAASRINDKTIEREEMFHDFLQANLVGEPLLINLVAGIEIETGLNYISTTGTATADVELPFGFLLGDGKRVAVTASAYESRNNLEIVMALDNTGSMGVARMAALRQAATSLVDILALAHSPDAEPRREVRAALVPFTTAVNVRGEGFNPDWIDWNAEAHYHGANFELVGGQRVNHFDLFDALDVEWKGCVEARPAPLNLSDASPDPSDPDTLFVPYFAPDEPGNARLPQDSPTVFNNTYLDDQMPGTPANPNQRQRQESTYKYGRASTHLIRNGHASVTSGPNYACPTPIMPLTSDFDVLKGEIDSMIHWYGSGTNVSEGLAWAQRVLSPGEPYTDGAPFNSENTSKFVVVFTDGENQVFGASGEAINKSDYGSYSFVDQGRIHTNRGQALTRVNDWTLAVCNDLKSKNVEIFTVLLGADTPANRALYTACATTPEHYYPTNDVSQLDAVFQRIASRIARLYVTH